MTGVADSKHVPIDKWDVRHLLLSIDARARDERDQADLDAVLQRVVHALDALPAPRGFVVAPGIEAVPSWWFETNAWIYAPRGGRECVVVDVPPRPDALVRRIAAEQLRVTAVLLTHGHVDHAGGTAELLGALPAPVPVYAHAADVPLVLDPNGAAGVLASAAGSLAAPPADCVVAVRDGDRITDVPVELVAIETPGHTPGSCCFVGPNVLFSGDHLFAGGGSGRCDLGGASRAGVVASTLLKLAPLDDGVVVLPGHGGATTIGAERTRWHHGTVAVETP